MRISLLHVDANGNPLRINLWKDARAQRAYSRIDKGPLFLDAVFSRQFEWLTTYLKACKPHSVMLLLQNVLGTYADASVYNLQVMSHCNY